MRRRKVTIRYTIKVRTRVSRTVRYDAGQYFLGSISQPVNGLPGPMYCQECGAEYEEPNEEGLCLTCLDQED